MLALRVRSRLTHLSLKPRLATIPTLRTMSSKTIAVLDESELRDGDMYGIVRDDQRTV